MMLLLGLLPLALFGATTSAQTLSAFYCSSGSMTGAGTNICTVKLNAASATSSQTVNLSSNNAAVAVPATVTLPPKATSAQLTAIVSSVLATQTVTLTATAGGVSTNVALQLNAYIPTLKTSISNMAFGNVVLNTPQTQSVTLTSTGTEPLTISAVALTGAGFSVSGGTFPLTLNPTQTAVLSVQFNPAAVGVVAGQLTITSNAYPSGTAVIGLSGTGWVPALSAFYCSTGSMMGAGTDACTVKLNAASSINAQTVSLSSNNAAVTVPATVTLPANATSAQFTATVSPVVTAQAVTLTANIGGVATNVALQLNAYVPTLRISVTSMAFGNVVLNTPQSQSVTLTSTGTKPLTISAAALTGAGFSVSGATFPLTLNPTQTAVLSVQFNPAAVGAVAGQLTITSNAYPSGTAVIGLSGTGWVPALSAFYCSTGSMMGAGTDVCTVKLNAASSINAQSVSLSSNNAAVTVPSTVTLPANATSAQFTATVSPVLTAQAVTLTASVGGVSTNVALQLNAYVPTLRISVSSMAFGNVVLNTPQAQSVTLASTGTEPVTISAATLTGVGFTVSGATFPLTLNPTQTAVLSVQFNPAAVGAVAGQLTITSNAYPSGTAAISLTGTGWVPALSAFYCSTGSMMGAGTVTCTVKLNAASSINAQSVSLSSNNTAVTVPSTVTLPANATSAQFTATVSSVLTAQAVTLTANIGGVATNTALQLNAYVPILRISVTSMTYGNVVLNTPQTQSVTLTSTGTKPLTISAASVTGAGFTVSGATFPLTLNPTQTAVLSVQFNPAAVGAVAAQLTITSNAYPGGTAAISLSGTGWVPALSALYCANASMTGSGTNVCTVKLNAASTINAQSVSLSSNNSAVTIPATITLPANVTSAQFTATVAPVVSTQAVTLTASINGVSTNAALQLNAYIPTLKLNTGSMAFGDVVLNTPQAQSVTLTSTGTEPLTISAATPTGAGFTVSGAAFPLTLNPGQAATLSVQFDPAAAGAIAGQLTITSNAYPSGTAAISLSGTGWVPTLSAFYCANARITGSGTDVCTLRLNGSSATSAQTVSLSSNNAAVSMPATVTLPANSTSAQFTATIASVGTAQATTLTATLGSVPASFALQLNAYIQTLSLSRTGVAFNDVVVNTTQTQSVALTSTGTVPLVVSGATLAGTGFTMSAPVLPLTLNPGQTAMVSVLYHPAAAGVTAGQIAITTNSSTSGTAVLGLSGTAVSGSSGTTITPGSFAYTGSPLSGTLAQANSSVAMTGSFFGMTVYNLAPIGTAPEANMTPFPAFPVSTLRLWDVAYWKMLEPNNGQFYWPKMDNTIAIAQQNGVSDFIFTFGQIPAWASTDPTDPCTGGEGPGTCSPPDMTALEEFATQVVQRYCGKVKYYEPWNEPNNSQFWDGTNAQMLAIAQQVYQIAKSPANCGCTNGVCSPNGGVNPNEVLLPPIAAINQQSIAWLNSYLASAGTPYPYADIAAFHGYVWQGYQPEQIETGVQLLQQTLATYGLSNLPLWNTETSWQWNVTYTQDQQAAWLMRSHAVEAALGIPRFVWYAYDSCDWGSLYSSPLCPTVEGTPGQLTEAGTAYTTIENWFIGANFVQCLQYQNGLWACELQRSGGYDAWMVWSSTGTSVSIPVPAGLTVYRDWQNNLNTLSTQLTVGQLPMLLENQDL